jgi:hypothetical protein
MTSSSETILGTGTKRAKEKHEKLNSLLDTFSFFPKKKTCAKRKKEI